MLDGTKGDTGSEERKGQDGMRWDEDVQNEVEDTFHHKQVDELVELPLPCSFVNSKRLPYKSDAHQRAHDRGMNELSNARRLVPTKRDKS